MTLTLRKKAKYSYRQVNKMKIKQVCELTELTERTIRSAIDLHPNFGRLDPETKEEKENAVLEFRVKQRIYDRIHRIWLPIRNVLLVLVGMAALLAVIVGISGIPKKIDVVYPAVEFRAEEAGYFDHTTVTIKGKLYTRLFSDPKFVGRLSIDKYDYTKTYEARNIIFYDDIWGGNLHYSTIISNQTSPNSAPEVQIVMESLGTILIEGDMDKVNIWVFEPIIGDSKSTKDLFISAPATTREEAVVITQQLSNYGALRE